LSFKKARLTLGMANVARMLRTVRTLSFSQCAYRITRRLDRWLGRLKVDTPTDEDLKIQSVQTLALLERIKAPLYHSFFTSEELKNGIFTIHHQSKKLGGSKIDWCLGPCKKDRLWIVTLHYHEWAYVLASNDKALFKEYLTDWMENCELNKPGARELAWNSYAVATRLGWWIASYHRCGVEFWEQEPDFKKTFLKSLWRQAEYLSKNVEWDLLANHILRDAAGLAMAGAFFEGPRADQWRQQALRIMGKQSRNQFLGDGGHYERSPMYQTHAMADLLTVALLSPDGEEKGALLKALPGIAETLCWMKHPDGGLALLNDSALNGGPSVKNLLPLLKVEINLQIDGALRKGLRHFKETGLVAWHSEPYTVFFDVGPLGPNEQCGHGHADNLTLELSYEGQRLFVDPGVFAYDEDAKRFYDRSTAAHNTVCVEGMDSSEVWKIFRVGRRAVPCDVKVQEMPNGFKATASHNGYDHLSGQPRHIRSIECKGSVLTVLDEVNGNGYHQLSGGWLLAPGWDAIWKDGGWELAKGDMRLMMKVKGPLGMKVTIDKMSYHPEFGLEIMVNRLVWSFSGELLVSIQFSLGPV
jgi:uncharacterized heparinase superfamily protein